MRVGDESRALHNGTGAFPTALVARAPPRLPRLYVQFAASGLIAVLLVAVVASFALRRAGTRESVREARRLTEVLARSVVEPNLAAGALDGDTARRAAFDRLIRTRVVGRSVVRVKLWRPDGRIAYSDEPRLIGARYPRDEDDRAALAGGRAEAGISDLSRPENRFERRYGKLLEVYMPVRTARGEPLLFEAYLRFSSVAASGRRLWLAFAPALVAALVLLWLVQTPLAFSLARRLRREHTERETLLLQALNASDVERRRIAADLHDGVVQDLAGTSYALAVAADRLEGGPEAEVKNVLDNAAVSMRLALRQLRSLLVEIYPPNLRDTGVSAAVRDVAAGLARRGVVVDVDAARDVDASAETERLVFRTAQEALRNVGDHADASNCRVSLRADDGGLELVVSDDGRGFEASGVASQRAHGHLGLTLLADRARDAGGSLSVESTPGRGTSVRLWVPSR